MLQAISGINNAQDCALPLWDALGHPQQMISSTQQGSASCPPCPSLSTKSADGISICDVQAFPTALRLSYCDSRASAGWPAVQYNVQRTTNLARISRQATIEALVCRSENIGWLTKYEPAMAPCFLSHKRTVQDTLYFRTKQFHTIGYHVSTGRAFTVPFPATFESYATNCW